MPMPVQTRKMQLFALMTLARHNQEHWRIYQMVGSVLSCPMSIFFITNACHTIYSICKHDCMLLQWKRMDMGKDSFELTQYLSLSIFTMAHISNVLHSLCGWWVPQTYTQCLHSCVVLGVGPEWNTLSVPQCRLTTMTTYSANYKYDKIR